MVKFCIAEYYSIFSYYLLFTEKYIFTVVHKFLIFHHEISSFNEPGKKTIENIVEWKMEKMLETNISSFPTMF